MWGSIGLNQEAKKWKRWERSLAYGAVIWATIVGFAVFYYPLAILNFIELYNPATLVGFILITFGLCGGLAQFIMGVADWIAEDSEDLTEWDGQ